MTKSQETRLSPSNALVFADKPLSFESMSRARELRDVGHRNVFTYSRKVFVPLTQLCRDVCHYCTFAKTPKRLKSPYLTVEEVLHTVKNAQTLGCQEVLFTLGERPELRYKAAQDALAELGYASTLQYLAAVAKRVIEETDLLPHINAGCMSADEMAMLRPVSASMGLMLESNSPRLCEPGGAHYGSPDKAPEKRLETLRIAGQLNVPFTTGILIGIGETRRERIEALLAIRDIQDEFGHIQEVIIQNFRAKPGTQMAFHPEPSLEELTWTIAMARLIFGPEMSLQAPPNLSPGVLPELVDAGLNDWGGVSPVTPDYVNPEAPWPNLVKLAEQTDAAGKLLQQRLTVYPQYARDMDKWIDPALHSQVQKLMDTEGFARNEHWFAGEKTLPPSDIADRLKRGQTLIMQPDQVSGRVKQIIKRAFDQEPLGEDEIVRLFEARGEEFFYICEQADQLRQKTVGDGVSYVVNCNINYTNICYFKCQFCAFSKGHRSENLRGKPYDLPMEEISDRVSHAWERGATEVCLQGGIHPKYTGQTYLDVLEAVLKASPGIHIHAFSPLEVWQGAKTLGLPVRNFLQMLKDAGLRSLPGTAAEILDDEVRAELCPDKIMTEQWLDVMRQAHDVGLKTTSTIMFGHLERLDHWARHLIRIRELQEETGGFTEFVPLSFVHRASPIFKKGNSRKGPTFRESVLMHAIARLVLNGRIDNIQVSWVKMGDQGLLAALAAGANDVGGTLMNESISRSAGASHGQDKSSFELMELIRKAGGEPYQRTTLYERSFEAKNSQKSNVLCGMGV